MISKPWITKWKIINEKGETIETFKNYVVAKQWLPKLKKEYYTSKLEIKRI